MLRHVTLIAAACASVALPGAAEERRELGAHEHGHSALNIAIEADQVLMELMAPGMDIVGFEHAAETDEDKAAIEQAEVALGDPLTLFVMPDAAGCVVEAAVVELETEDEHAEEAGHAEEHADEHAEDEHGEEHAEHEGEELHTEFHAEYALTCASPDELGSIEFAYFDRFPGAEEVEVTVISESVQTRYEVERDSPRIELLGLI